MILYCSQSHITVILFTLLLVLFVKVVEIENIKYTEYGKP